MTPCPLDPGDLGLPVLGSRECDFTARLLWEYLDHALWLPERAAIDVHLAHCERCRVRVAFEDRLRDAIRSLQAPEHLDVTGLSRRVVAALRAAREET